MLALLQRKSLRLLQPILKRLVNFYFRKPRNFKHDGLKLTIGPTVFHPGLVYSTKFLLSHVENYQLKGKQVLELGAGSGLIALSCARKGARVTASDINQEALNWLEKNAQANQCELTLIHSDLFDQFSPAGFHLIIINPPYYPKAPENDKQRAWYCGEEFEYFQKLFTQLKEGLTGTTQVIMVLSEDCDLERISQLGLHSGFTIKELDAKHIGGERNAIYAIQSS